MFLTEMLINAVKKENGKWKINDIDLHSDNLGVDVSIFWHSAAYNVGFYPIIQVDDEEGNMVLWDSGPENSSDWYRWMEETLEDYLGADDWWLVM